ncbi:CASP-like protein 2U1 [Zea mays]|uniref:CASP-like protein n=1 Tax=Zea mays TaxID=4577 RepID=A0A3L6G6Q4_MAIZE|nr:CASP-like protein 2U1 [Zea mays]
MAFTSCLLGSDAERKVAVAEVALRAVLCGLGALAAALVATDTQTRTFFSLQKKATYTDMKAMVLLVAAAAAAAGYSLLQAARCCCCVALLRTSIRPRPRARLLLAWCVFACDQALAYALLAAVAAALQASVVAKQGLPQLQWTAICALYGAFCRQAGAGVACAVAAAVDAALLAFLSAFNLFRLYGAKATTTT